MAFVRLIMVARIIAFLVPTVTCCSEDSNFVGKLLYQFPSIPFVSLENVAIRPNGELLLTSTSTPTVHLFNTYGNAPPALLYTFPNATSSLGITQVAPDLFAVAVGTVNITTFAGVPGSFSIWLADLSDDKSPSFSEIAGFPQAKILNGLTHIPSDSAIVFAADSEEGTIYSLNVTSGAVGIALSSTAFGPGGKGLLGINGLHFDTAGDKLSFTNSAQRTYGVVSTGTNDGNDTDTIQILATEPTSTIYDDFALDKEGNAWIATHPSTLTKITASGQQLTVFNSSQFLQPTSAIFSADGQTLYVVTDGDAVHHSQSGQIWAFGV